MRILLLSSSYNSLTQNAHVWLKSEGYAVGVAAATTAEAMRDAVGRFRPDLILCPMLAQVIPADIWQTIPCLIVHPGILGDRGPASLDWAILNGEKTWGVTVMQAAAEVDSGPVWASCRFPMREGSKSSLYRDEVAQAAMQAMALAVRRFEGGLFVPAPLDYSRREVEGRFRPGVRQELRRIDWQRDTVAEILKKIRSADGSPGLLDEIGGEAVYLYGAHPEGALVGPPGAIIAQRHGAICRAASDGAVWISHLRRKGAPAEGCFKLPAAQLLQNQLIGVPEVALPFHQAVSHRTFRDIWYEERNGVGYVNFRFYNGAMGTDHCQRLAEAVMYARSRPTQVIVLAGGRDFFSNGIHLNVIEAADDPAEESWRNINAMNDLVHRILTAAGHITLAAMYGSAGAGGVMLAAAADRVLARDGIVLNPHYKSMGELYGSEYWTYTLPKRVGGQMALRLTEQCLPIGVQQAKALGLVDDVIVQDEPGGSRFAQFREQVVRIAEYLAQSDSLDAWLVEKQEALRADESVKPLAAYRHEELLCMKRNFWGEDRSYHLARSAFVRKLPRPGHLRCALAQETAGASESQAELKRSSRSRASFASHGGATARWPAANTAATGESHERHDANHGNRAAIP